MASMALVAKVFAGVLAATGSVGNVIWDYELDPSTIEGAKAGSLSFPDFVKAFDRGYVMGTDEYAARRALYEHRATMVREHNQRPGRTWHATINHFADHTDAELSMYRGRRGWGGHSASSGSSFLEGRAETVDNSSSCSTAAQSSVDWEHLASLKKVKSQGVCGSCWAVATSVMLEARYEIANKKNDRTFSAQELVECTPNERQCGGTGGCGGATVELAMQYVQQNGLGEETSRPYTSSRQSGLGCPGSAGSAGQSSFLLRGYGSGHGKGLGSQLLGLRSWQKLDENKQEPLLSALLEGPVAISADAQGWSMYGGGVFSDCKRDAIVNHAIVAIGFGEDPQHGKFWNIRNSWGKGWGEKGNIRIKRLETDSGAEGHCGVDRKPKDGTACKPYPDEVPVCGMCGVLYDSVTADFHPL